jgi:hypothetical protein
VRGFLVLAGCLAVHVATNAAGWLVEVLAEAGVDEDTITRVLEAGAGAWPDGLDTWPPYS